MYDGIEKKILKKMSESLVMRKSELIEFLNGEEKVSESVVNSITRLLVQKGLITKVYATESTFAITQKGIKEVNRSD